MRPCDNEGRGCGRQTWAVAVPAAGSGEGQAGPWTLSTCGEGAEVSSGSGSPPHGLSAVHTSLLQVVLPQGRVGPESLHVSGAPRGHRAARWSANHVNCILGLGLRLPRLRGLSHMEGEKQAASVNFTVNSLQSTPTEGVPVRCQSSTEPRIQGGRGWSGFCDH